MIVNFEADLDVCIHGSNVMLYIYDTEGEVVDERSFSIYELVKDYMKMYAIGDAYKFGEEDNEDVKALISELDDSLTLVSECLDKEMI